MQRFFDLHSRCPSTTDLDHHRSFVVAKCHVIRALHARDGPASFETVVERRLETVGIRMPQFHCSIFRSADNDGQFGMKCHAADVLRVSIERLNACFILDECNEWNTAGMHAKNLPDSPRFSPDDRRRPRRGTAYRRRSSSPRSSHLSRGLRE